MAENVGPCFNSVPHLFPEATEWYADRDPDAREDCPWTPVLVSSVDNHVVTSCNTWFQTEQDCIDFINMYLIGATLDKDIEQEPGFKTIAEVQVGSATHVSELIDRLAERLSVDMLQYVYTADQKDEEGLTPAGHHVRAVAASGNEVMRPWSYVPCAREHEPNRICIREDGHA